MEWGGKIMANKSEICDFDLESINHSQLYIDDKLVLDDKTLNQYQGKTIDLSEGIHEIKIRFSDLTGATHINLFWKPPDSELQYIPSNVLSLP
jgi:hypothetical protein